MGTSIIQDRLEAELERTVKRVVQEEVNEVKMAVKTLSERLANFTSANRLEDIDRRIKTLELKTEDTRNRIARMKEEEKNLQPSPSHDELKEIWDSITRIRARLEKTEESVASLNRSITIIQVTLRELQDWREETSSSGFKGMPF